MQNKFEQTYKQSEETNDLLKKIESTLANTRKELAENLKKMESLTSDETKAN